MKHGLRISLVSISLAGFLAACGSSDDGAPQKSSPGADPLKVASKANCEADEKIFIEGAPSCFRDVKEANKYCIEKQEGKVYQAGKGCVTSGDAEGENQKQPSEQSEYDEATVAEIEKRIAIVEKATAVEDADLASLKGAGVNVYYSSDSQGKPQLTHFAMTMQQTNTKGEVSSSSVSKTGLEISFSKEGWQLIGKANFLDGDQPTEVEVKVMCLNPECTDMAMFLGQGENGNEKGATFRLESEMDLKATAAYPVKGIEVFRSEKSISLIVVEEAQPELTIDLGDGAPEVEPVDEPKEQDSEETEQEGPEESDVEL